MDLLLMLLAFWRASPHTQLLALSLVVMVVSGALGAMVSSQLRAAGLVQSPGEEGLDWARVLGLLAGVWGLLLGGAFVTSWFSLVGVWATLLSQLAGVLAGLTAAGGILAGTAAYTRAQVAAAPRDTRAAVRRRQEPVRLVAMLLSALAVAQLGLGLPLILLAVGVAAVWAYRTPWAWAEIESAIASFRAGHALRKMQLEGPDVLDELNVAGPVGLATTPVEADGVVAPMENPELLKRARAARREPAG